MRVLVTGAFGNVGRSTLSALAAEGDEVTVLEADSPVNRRLARRLAQELGFRDRPAFTAAHFGDIRDPGLVARALEGQEAVVHLAALIPPKADSAPELARSINVGGTKTLIEAALSRTGGTAQRKLPCFVLASSISVYGDRVRDFWISTGDELKPSPGDEYGRSKVDAEALLRASGLPFSVLRLTYIVWRKKLEADPLLFHMPLATKLEICHTEDTGRAFAAAVHAPGIEGRTFDIGGGETCRTDYRGYLDRMLSLFGLGGSRILPDRAFAQRDFHCGWYADSDEAEKVLHFRRKGIEDYFAEVAEETRFLRLGATLARPIIAARLLATSAFMKVAPT